MTVLAAAGALMMGHADEAKEYLDAAMGEYTPALQRFVDSIYLLLNPDMAKEMGADGNTCAFYLVNFFEQKDPKAKAEEERIRMAKEEEEAKRKAIEEQNRKAMEEAERKRQEEKVRKAEEEERRRIDAVEQQKKAQAKQEDDSQTFSVVLVKVGAAKFQVAKAIMDALGRSPSAWHKAQVLVDGAPSTLKESLSKAEAESLKKAIEAAGATIKLIVETEGKDCSVAAKSASKLYSVQPQTNKELRSIIKERLRKNRSHANLNDIDISKIKNMCGVFKGLKVGNIDISEWDVSHVTNMTYMFSCCKGFNSDISKWDVSNVKTMYCMFYECGEFEGKGLEKWNVSTTTNTEMMFSGCGSLKSVPSWYRK
jgi:surface protein